VAGDSAAARRHTGRRDRALRRAAARRDANTGRTVLVYRDQDLRNYCQVSLLARGGRIQSFTADHAAPEFLWLRDGSNYCGRIFQGCRR